MQPIEHEISEIKYRLTRNLDIDFMEGAEAAMEVTCEDTAKHALSMALQSRKLEQTLESSRLELTKPHLDYQRAINKLVKDFNEKLQTMQKSLQDKIEGWVKENSDNPFVYLDKIRVEDGCLYTLEEWNFEVVIPEIVPNEFLSPDHEKIKVAVKNGYRNIPGVKIEKSVRTIMRVKN